MSGFSRLSSNLDQVGPDEADDFENAPLISLQSGVTGFTHAIDGEYDLDVFRLDLAPGTHTITVSPDVRLVVNVPDTITQYYTEGTSNQPGIVAESEVVIRYAIIYERVIVDGVSQYYEVTFNDGFDTVYESSTDPEIAQYYNHSGDILIGYYQDSESITFRATAAHTENFGGTQYVYTGEYYLVVQTDSAENPYYASALNVDEPLTGRYLISYGETDSRDTEWGSDWVDRYDYTTGDRVAAPIGLTVSDASVVEVDGGATSELVFTVTLATPSDLPVTVSYSTVAGTATQGSGATADYLGLTGTLTFNPGQTTAQVRVEVRGDAVVEGNETLSLVLSNPSNAVIDRSTGTGTIVDNDGTTPPPTAPTVSVIGASVAEGDYGSASELVFEVRLSAPSSEVVIVAYSTGFGGSAVVGEDFAYAEGNLIFAPGETVQYVAVSIIPDDASEPNETVILSLDNALGATIGTATASGVITNDDGGDQYSSPFPEGTGLEPTQPVTEETGRWSTAPAEYNPTTGHYVAEGTVLEDFAVGREGIIVPSAQELVGTVYRFIIQSTDPQIAAYLNGWFGSAERGAAVADHFEDQFETGFAIADAIANDDDGFDVEAAFQQVEARYNQFLVDMGTSIGLDFGIRWGTQNSAISTVLDIDARDQTAPIIAAAGHHDIWFGGSTADTIRLGDLDDAAWGGWGNDSLYGETGDDVLHGSRGDDILDGGSGSDSLIGGEGNDQLYGGSGADRLSGNSGNDSFRGSAAELNGDTITDFAAGDSIIITSATLSSFSYSLTGSTLTYSGGSLNFAGALAGTLVASAASGGGVQLTLSTAPAITRAKLILTESGQDIILGGSVAVLGTIAGGEVIEIVRGDVTLDASFNAGGDTVVLPGNASSYSAVLNGSFVTISGGGVSVAIPVGLAGLSIQFANSTRTLEIEGGQVVLGTQQITSTVQQIAASGPALVNPAETGPDSFAKLILTASGQDLDVGGSVNVFGTVSGGEIITILGGEVRLDASFNAGGDTVVLPGSANAYGATLSGSFVTITNGDISVAIPVGIAGMTVKFSDATLTLVIDTSSGTVELGGQIVPFAGAGEWNYLIDGGKDGALDQEIAGWSAAPFKADIEIDGFHRFEVVDHFAFG